MIRRARASVRGAVAKSMRLHGASMRISGARAWTAPQPAWIVWIQAPEVGPRAAWMRPPRAPMQWGYQTLRRKPAAPGLRLPPRRKVAAEPGLRQPASVKAPAALLRVSAPGQPAAWAARAACASPAAEAACNLKNRAKNRRQRTSVQLPAAAQAAAPDRRAFRRRRWWFSSWSAARPSCQTVKKPRETLCRAAENTPMMASF